MDSCQGKEVWAKSLGIGENPVRRVRRDGSYIVTVFFKDGSMEVSAKDGRGLGWPGVQRKGIRTQERRFL